MRCFKCGAEIGREGHDVRTCGQSLLQQRDAARAAAREIRHQARSQFGMTTDKLDALHPWLKALEAE